MFSFLYPVIDKDGCLCDCASRKFHSGRLGSGGGGGEMEEGGTHGPPTHHPVASVVHGNTAHPLTTSRLQQYKSCVKTARIAKVEVRYERI